MAYFEKRTSAKGVVSWRVQIRKRGIPQTRTFRTKARAKEWAVGVEAGLEGDQRRLTKHTLADAAKRWVDEVAPHRLGGRWESIRLKALEDDFAKLPMTAVGEDHVALWRDRRLKSVAPATARREMNLLQAVFELARVEWKWVRSNPFRGVKKPTEPPSRRRGVKEGELAKLEEKAVTAADREVLAGFELGIESGMRAGEMWSLEADRIDLRAGVAHLERTKNGDTRDVALTRRAVTIIKGLLADGRPTLFSISNPVRDTLFRRLRDAAGIPDLHFHDSRAEAVARLSKRLNVLELAEQIGHRDLNSLQFYYRQPAAERAKRLRASARTKPGPRKQPTAGARRRQP